MNSLKFRFDPAIIAANFPPELLSLPRFVVWREEVRDGKATKVPHSGLLSRRARANEPQTWHSFAAACTFARILTAKNPKTTIGIGFQFFGLKEFFGIDLDKCRDADTGVIEPWAAEIISNFATYAEISQSGTGVHLIGIGQKPGPRCRDTKTRPGLEIYGNGSGRFFVVTGNSIPGSPATTTDCQKPLDTLYRETFGNEPAGSPAVAVATAGHAATCACGCRRSPHLHQPTESPGDEKIFSKIRNSKSSAKFFRLFSGDTSDFGGDHSAADLSLCSLLAFWTGPDAGRIDSIFRQSALYREKWDRQDYQQATLRKAIAGCRNFYEWEPAPKPASAPQTAAPADGTPDGARKSSSLGEDTHRRTLTRANSPPPELLAPGIEKPAVTQRYSICRAIKLRMTKATDPTLKRISGFACRQHGCPYCGPVWEDDRFEWYWGIVSQFKEIFSSITSTPEESKALYQQIVRRTRKGENALYVKIPLANGQELWLTTHSTTISKTATLDEALEALTYAIRDVPKGKRIGCSRGLVFSKAKDQPTSEWVKDAGQGPLSRATWSRIEAVLNAHFENVKNRDIESAEQRNMTFRVPDGWTDEDARRLDEEMIPDYVVSAPRFRIRSRPERAAFVLNPTPTG